MSEDPEGDDPIDELAVARSLARLDKIAAEHPELVTTGANTEDNRAAWEASLADLEQGDNMTPPKERESTTQVAFRLPDSLIERIDNHVERMRDQLPGIEITRADAVRSLLTRALDDVEGKRKGRG